MRLLLLKVADATVVCDTPRLVGVDRVSPTYTHHITRLTSLCATALSSAANRWHEGSLHQAWTACLRCDRKRGRGRAGGDGPVGGAKGPQCSPLRQPDNRGPLVTVSDRGWTDNPHRPSGESLAIDPPLASRGDRPSPGDRPSSGNRPSYEAPRGWCPFP